MTLNFRIKIFINFIPKKMYWDVYKIFLGKTEAKVSESQRRNRFGFLY